MPLTVAIVGRPNVGKSTLFNRLAGKKLAIVHDTPGVTRDRHEVLTELGPLSLRLIDTAGFEEGEAGSLSHNMTEQTRRAIAEADVCLFCIDGREGVTTGDEIIAQALRRSGKPVVLIANKCEGRFTPNEAETYALGFGEALPVSAEHALGVIDIMEALLPFAPEQTAADEDEERVREGNKENDNEDESEIPRGPLKLAIVGRPNVGKSSLFNRLLGEERALTSPIAGTTRDAVIAQWSTPEREVLLHDTAGLRKKARVAGHILEELSVDSTLEAIRFAECVVVMIDAQTSFEKQDLTIADLIAKEGRSIVFAVNKWDLVENKNGAISDLRRRLDNLLPQVAGAPLIGISAKTGEGVDRLLPAILEADAAWNRRIPTAQLNRFLEDALQRHPPPAVSGRRVRVRYMTQAKSRPPTFALFGNQLNALPEHYVRYLQNEIREAFNLRGVPLRFSLRTSKNPFA
jgi:GTP-binding protein